MGEPLVKRRELLEEHVFPNMDEPIRYSPLLEASLKNLSQPYHRRPEPTSATAVAPAQGQVDVILVLVRMLHCATGGVEGVSGGSHGNRVACNPNDVSIH